MTGTQIQQQGAGKPHRIDAVVHIETAVFHGDEGGRQIGGHLFQLQPFADNRAAMSGFFAISIQEGEGQGAIDRIKIGMRVGGRREQSQQRRQQEQDGGQVP